MANPRQHVLPGQPLAISAVQINFLNRLMAADTSFRAGPLDGWQFGGTICYARNDTGADVPRWGAMEIAGLGVLDRTQFEAMPVLSGTQIVGMAMKWCVAIEPIAAGKIGRVAVAGAVQVLAADVPKLFGAVRLWVGTASPDLALVLFQGGSTLKAGTFTGAWPKGTTKSVTLYEPENHVISVKNSIADLTNGCGSRFCIVSYVMLPSTPTPLSPEYGWTLISSEVA